MSRRWKKPWSVKDTNHVRSGERVIARSAPSIAIADRAMSAFGVTVPKGRRMLGVVTHRSAALADWYMVKLDGDARSTYGMRRADFIHPVPDGVVPFDPGIRRRRP